MLFLITLLVCIFIVSFVLILKHLGYLVVALKTGASCVLLLLVGSFLYGLFNDFSFIHGSSRAGLESATTYTVLFGVYIGPFVFFIGGILGAIISYLRKTKGSRD
jgi:hypothetical protein